MIHAWILMIMISVGPWSGHSNPDYVVISIEMKTEQACLIAQQHIMLLQYEVQHIQPNLLINADCQPVLQPILYGDRNDQ